MSGPGPFFQTLTVFLQAEVSWRCHALEIKRPDSTEASWCDIETHRVLTNFHVCKFRIFGFLYLFENPKEVSDRSCDIFVTQSCVLILPLTVPGFGQHLFPPHLPYSGGTCGWRLTPTPPLLSGMGLLPAQLNSFPSPMQVNQALLAESECCLSSWYPVGFLVRDLASKRKNRYVWERMPKPPLFQGRIFTKPNCSSLIYQPCALHWRGPFSLTVNFNVPWCNVNTHTCVHVVVSQCL